MELLPRYIDNGVCAYHKESSLFFCYEAKKKEKLPRKIIQMVEDSLLFRRKKVCSTVKLEAQKKKKS